MNVFTAIAIGLLFVTIVVSVFYNCVARPILLRSIMYRIFSKRDALRRMAVESGDIAKSANFHYLQDFLCKSIALIPNLSILAFCKWAVLPKGARLSVPQEDFEQTAPEELKKLRRDTVEDVLAILVLNSPFVTALGLAAMPLLLIIGKVRTMKLFQATEGFVFNLEGTAAA